MPDDFDSWYRCEAAPVEGALRRRLVRILPSAADAEDVLWSAYEKLLVSGAWRNAERPADLIFRIARNIAIDHLRRQKVVTFEHAADALMDAVFDEPSADERVDDRRAVEVLRGAIAALPTQCREVFVMRRVRGLSPLDIAERTGLSVSTIEKHVAKGLKLCAERLAREGYERKSLRTWIGRVRTAKP